MRVPHWCVLTLLVAAPANARAAAGDGSVVVDQLRRAGDAGADVEGEIRGAIVRGLTSAGLKIVDDPDAGQACANAECVAAMASQTGATYVVGGKVEVAQRSYELTLEAYGPDGQVVATKSTSCPICSVPEAEQAAAAAATELAASLPKIEVEAPTNVAPLTITSNPAGAIVYVDGALAGDTPFERALEPGEHTIEVRMEGYTPQTRALSVAEGASPEPIDLTLIPRKTPLQLAPLGWAAVGVGAASLITGVALLVLDENPYKAHCDGPDIDAMGRCRFRYDTLGGGIAGVVVGAAFIGGGVGLVMIDRKRKGPKPSARAELRIGAQARGITLSGRF